MLIEDWRIEYNTKRPHSSLDWLAPATYADRWHAVNWLDSHKGWTREWGPVMKPNANLLAKCWTRHSER